MKLKDFNKIVIGVCLAILVFTALNNNARSLQDIKKNPTTKFKHQAHIESIECKDCHVADSVNVSLNHGLLPPKTKCAECHDVQDTSTCSQCHFEGKQTPFKYEPFKGLVFNHKLHGEREIECSVCHEKVNSEDKTKLIVTPKMDVCRTCHSENISGTNDCQVCHKTLANTVPAAHLESDFLRKHGINQTGCNSCHNNSFCETCHSSTLVENNSLKSGLKFNLLTSGDFGNNLKTQKLAAAHRLDYSLTHGIDAKMKSSNCLTCHQIETFCAPCHNEKSSLGDVLPASHLVKNFTTIGVGSGGGEHASIARRDIEICMSCHDTQGSDPNCILCHIDNDGIKGTNPKTHPNAKSIMQINDDWHHSLSSVCYNCHTGATANPSAISGVGFCGYCHGKK